MLIKGPKDGYFQRRDKQLSAIARNILNGIPSTGMHRLDPSIVNR